MRRRALLLLALPACALAQTSKQQSAPIYRCGPDGRQLSDKPCSADAPASGVRFDEPSEADRRAARERTKREALQADRLQRQRQAQERQPAPAPQRLSPAPEDPAPKKKKSSKPKQPAQPKRSGSKSP